MTTESKQTLIERLFGAGAHFGFSKSRRHPTIAPYIFGSKQGTDIIDLEKTAALIEDAKAILSEAGKNGKTVLFVATKEEISPIISERAVQLEMPYVTNRWIGGMLTNFSEIRKRIERLKQLQEEQTTGELERKYVKKERMIIHREIEKLSYNFGGIIAMDRRPDYMVVVDPRHEEIAVAEANDMKIPVIAVMSSDCDASKVTHPVILNDSLQASVSLALDELVGAFKAGRAEYQPRPARTTTTQTRRPVRST